MNQPLSILPAANRALSAAWARGYAEPPTLDPDRIEAFAAGKEGLSRVPGEQWREALRILTSDLEECAALSPMGRIMANGQLVRLLRARCRAERLLRAHPEIAERPIERPLIIMGAMRSGTTRLQRLLACDPRLAVTRTYETLDPVPQGRGFDRRVPAAAALLAFLHRVNPALAAIHPTSPRAAEEEFGHLSFSMHGAQFEAQWRLPRFVRWSEARDTAQVYRELRALLQLNGWARRERTERWVLKCPQFTADPQALLAAFPDARMIFLHRDPVSVVASSASLIWQQRRLHSDSADPHEVGAEWLRKTADRARRTAAFRATHPQVPQIDLHYDEIGRDWRGALARVYGLLDWDLPPAVLARMERYLRSARTHHAHRYSLEQFGLEAAAVRRKLDAAAGPPTSPAPAAAKA